MNKIIWEATLDGQYACFVARVDEYNGILTIEDLSSSNLIHVEEVTLSYQAIFGPDVYDVALWEEKCIEVVDKL